MRYQPRSRSGPVVVGRSLDGCAWRTRRQRLARPSIGSPSESGPRFQQRRAYAVSGLLEDGGATRHRRLRGSRAGRQQAPLQVGRRTSGEPAMLHHLQRFGGNSGRATGGPGDPSFGNTAWGSRPRPVAAPTHRPRPAPEPCRRQLKRTGACPRPIERVVAGQFLRIGRLSRSAGACARRRISISRPRGGECRQPWPHGRSQLKEPAGPGRPAIGARAVRGQRHAVQEHVRGPRPTPASRPFRVSAQSQARAPNRDSNPAPRLPLDGSPLSPSPSPPERGSHSSPRPPPRPARAPRRKGRTQRLYRSAADTWQPAAPDLGYGWRPAHPAEDEDHASGAANRCLPRFCIRGKRQRPVRYSMPGGRRAPEASRKGTTCGIPQARTPCGRLRAHEELAVGWGAAIELSLEAEVEHISRRLWKRAKRARPVVGSGSAVARRCGCRRHRVGASWGFGGGRRRRSRAAGRGGACRARPHGSCARARRCGRAGRSVAAVAAAACREGGPWSRERSCQRPTRVSAMCSRRAGARRDAARGDLGERSLRVGHGAEDHRRDDRVERGVGERQRSAGARTTPRRGITQARRRSSRVPSAPPAR